MLAHFRAINQRLTEDRLKTKRLGRLGPAEFETPSDFFSKRQFAPVYTLETWTPDRVLCVGDVHGDLAVFLASLCQAGVVDADGFWTGSSCVVVQVGDFLDRGGRMTRDGQQISLPGLNPREEIDIMEYAYFLDQQAREHGGAVILLSGNHEYFNFCHEFACTTPITNEGWGGSLGRENWFARGPDSALARYFVARHPIIVRLGKHVFVHGGLGPRCQNDAGQGDFDQYVVRANAAFTEFLLNQKAGLEACAEEILLSRQISDQFSGSRAECREVAHKMFAEVGLRADAVLYVGHTPQVLGYQAIPGVNGVCGESIWRLDVAASAAFGLSDRAQCLEIRNERDHAGGRGGGRGLVFRIISAT